MQRFLLGSWKLLDEKHPANLAVYEANFLMYTATGKADWWVRIRRDKDAKFTIPCHIQSNRDYQINMFIITSLNISKIILWLKSK